MILEYVIKDDLVNDDNFNIQERIDKIFLEIFLNYRNKCVVFDIIFPKNLMSIFIKNKIKEAHKASDPLRMPIIITKIYNNTGDYMVQSLLDITKEDNYLTIYIDEYVDMANKNLSYLKIE